MIHRFVDLLEVVLRPIWPVMVTQGSPSNFNSLFLTGGALPAVRLNKTLSAISSSSTISDPMLSPDETEVVWGLTDDPPGATPTNAKVMVAPSDDLTGPTTVVTDPDVPYTFNFGLSPCWHPDGTKIIFNSPGTTFFADSEIKRVNRDGTGLTSLRTLTTGHTSYVSYSASGDYIVYTIRDYTDAANAQIWVMEDDGSNATNIYTAAIPVAFITANFPAWQRGADVLAFRDPDTTPVYKTINADGTGLTTIFTDTGNAYGAVNKYSWLSDDSALAVFHLVGSVGKLALIDGGGGGATDIGPTDLAQHNVWVAVTSQETRIYYSKIVTGVRILHSCAEDGSDERMELDPTGFSPTAIHHGIYGINAN